MKVGADISKPTPALANQSPPEASFRERWSLFQEDMPRPLRIYLLLTGSVAVILGSYCLAWAILAPSPYWLVLVFCQICASFFSVKSPVLATKVVDERKLPRPQASVRSWEFFIYAGLVCYSPEVMVVVGMADALTCSMLQLNYLRIDRVAYNMGSAVLYLYLPGKCFYWLLGQPPPLEGVGAAGGLWILAVMAFCSFLQWTLNVAAMAYALWMTTGISPLSFARTCASTLLPMVVGSALGAASISLLFGENALLVVLASAPFILLLLSYTGAYRQQVLALTESREFLQSSLDSLSSYIAVLDQSGRVVATNHAWRTSTKHSRPFGGWIGLGANYLGSCRDGMGEKLARSHAIADGIDEVLAGRRESFRLDYSCGPAEPEAWFEVRVSRFRVAHPLRVVVAHQDITDKKLSESRLRESEERYRQFFEDDLTADFVADAEGRLADCNPAFARIFGFESPREVVGTELASLFPDREECARLFDALARAGKLEYREMELVSALGDPVHVVANLSGRFDDGGRLREVEGYLFDDTRRKTLELELAEAHKMEAVGQLAGGIAHDFNNLLTVVTGYGEFLHASLADHRTLASEARRILDAAQQAADVTSKLLAFSRRQVVRHTVLDLNQVVAEISRILRRLIGEDIELTTRLAAETATIRLDPGQMEQIILNLAVNSRDAMPEGGVLLLETEEVEEMDADPEGRGVSSWIRLRVKDSGSGMTPDIRRRAFEPFFTTKEKGKGTGLGLSTVYGIVQQSGGRVEIQSEPGSGTCVELYFPKVAVARDAVGPSAREHGPRGGETILLVEDENDIRQLIRNVLSSRGYNVLEAGDGVEAIDLLERAQGPVHLLLTDMVMPRMGGWELVQTVRRGQRHAAIKVLFISAYPGEEQALGAAVSSGREAYLPKPFSSEALLSEVRLALDS